MRKKLMITLWTLFLGIVGFVALLFVLIENGTIGYMPDLQQLENPVDKYASQVYSEDGTMLGTWSYSRANRVFVGYDDLSPYLVKALVSTEDERFYEHSGIDFRAIMRAMIKRVVLRQKHAGGGSTITQQLAKQLYSAKAGSIYERAMQKPIEWVIAVKLERYYTKEEIITMYLNYFDFLHNAVGIKTAARTYFNKDPRDLTINECAMLIGMCKNPSLFNPVRRPDQARERRDVVLEQMLKNGWLTRTEADSCEALPVELKTDMPPTFVNTCARYLLPRNRSAAIMPHGRTKNTMRTHLLGLTTHCMVGVTRISTRRRVCLMICIRTD